MSVLSPSGLMLWSMVGKPFERVFRFPLMPNFEVESGAIECTTLTSAPDHLIALHPVTYLYQKLRGLSV
jgi:hypothetical protein